MKNDNLARIFNRWPLGNDLPIVILLPFLPRFACVTYSAKQSLVKASLPLLAVEAFDEAVLLGLSHCTSVYVQMYETGAACSTQNWRGFSGADHGLQCSLL